MIAVTSSSRQDLAAPAASLYLRAGPDTCIFLEVSENLAPELAQELGPLRASEPDTPSARIQHLDRPSRAELVQAIRSLGDEKKTRLRVAPGVHGWLRPDLKAGLVVSGFQASLDELVLFTFGMAGVLARLALSTKAPLGSFHAASVASRDQALLLPGASGAGKTLVSLLCGFAGFSCLSDEESWVCREDDALVVVPFARRHRVPAPLLTARPHWFRNEAVVRPYSSFGEEGMLFDLNRLGPTGRPTRVRLAGIVELSPDPDTETLSLQPLSRFEARLALARSLETLDSRLAGPTRAPDLRRYNRNAFEMIDALIGLPAFRLQYSTARHGAEVPGRLSELLSELP